MFIIRPSSEADLPAITAIYGHHVLHGTGTFEVDPAYKFSAEDSIYLSSEFSGKGCGALMLAELMTQAQRAGVRKLIAVIGDSANTGSIGVHRAAGFQPVGVLKSCGWKFNRWLDVVLMDKAIGESDDTPPAVPNTL